jgi:hypothetical protein
MDWAAIHTSFSGIGVPARANAALILPYSELLFLPALRSTLDGFSYS